jgi:Glycosyl transferase family 2
LPDRPLSILIAARDEEARIFDTVARLRAAFPTSAIVVGDDGSRDSTASRARQAGATVVSGPRLGKGEALNAAERAAPPGPVLLVDADLAGDVSGLMLGSADLVIAHFPAAAGGGFGIAKRAARELIRARAGRELREPLSGQRFLSERARAAAFPLARGFGCEVRMTIDVLRAGLEVEEVDLPLSHRPTGRDLRGFAHRGCQLVEATFATGPLALNHRGNRLPLIGLASPITGLLCGRRSALPLAAIAAVGFVDDLRSGPERGFRAHLSSGRTTGVLKLVAIPLIGMLATRSPSGGVVVGLAANAMNQLDTKPGRALKAFLVGASVCRGVEGPYLCGAVLALPYDLRERVMLGDAGSNALGAVLGLALVARTSGWRRLSVVVALGALNVLGERTSLGTAIERSPALSALDSLGRLPA